MDLGDFELGDFELAVILGLDGGDATFFLAELVLVELVVETVALAFLFDRALRSKARTNSSFFIECQPWTPFFLAIWARSFEV